MTPGGAPARPDPEALELVSRVCARIAHDLNNVLAAIDGYSAFVAQEVSSQPQVLADINEVRKAAARGVAFSRRLRMVGQLLESAPESLDVSQLVAEAREELSGLAGEGVALSLELAPNLPPVKADQQQLRMALRCLVENAREAMPAAGTLTITTTIADGEVAIRVVDTGAGIAPELVPRVWEPFFSTKDKAIGNGLGLFVVDGVARGVGGRGEIRPAVGGGTSVTLFFPTAG